MGELDERDRGSHKGCPEQESELSSLFIVPSFLEALGRSSLAIDQGSLPSLEGSKRSLGSMPSSGGSKRSWVLYLTGVGGKKFLYRLLHLVVHTIKLQPGYSSRLGRLDLSLVGGLKTLNFYCLLPPDSSLRSVCRENATPGSQLYPKPDPAKIGYMERVKFKTDGPTNEPEYYRADPKKTALFQTNLTVFRFSHHSLGYTSSSPTGTSSSSISVKFQALHICFNDATVEEFNIVATKQAKGFGLGYVNGFVMILIDDLSRPRFTRWDGNFIYTEKEILKELRGITNYEKDLLLRLSPPASPIWEASPSRVPFTTTAESTQPTPASPVRLSSPPKHDSATPTPVSPVRFSSQSHPDSSAHPESRHVDDQTNLAILNKSIYELFNKHNFMKKKVADVEATNHILEHRIHFLEDSVFDLEKENFNLKEQIKKKNWFLMQFFEEQFPSYFKTYKKEMCAPSSLSPTVSEDTTLSDSYTNSCTTTSNETYTNKSNCNSSTLEQENVTDVDLPVVKATIVYEVDENKEILMAHATEMLDYPGRALISEDKRLIIDNGLKQFKFNSDSIFELGIIAIYRSQLDELLMLEEIDNNHIDAFGHLLTQKEAACPGCNQPFLFVSSFHWISHFYKDTEDAFDIDISTWLIKGFPNVPTQNNSVD
ncbi:hypothetical protein MA16_Dca018487 [Dendrobium catenatum]|uniref:Uncharacterized protein n=1 Tax=Dendrobium catenatum TaxID=906689 RepID=A0A2I0X6E2_9ASPA|nr:hypothetical protein MA16_Dca018487 [Dendrobium catenatum]